MNTIIILCASVIASISGQTTDSTTPAVKPIPVQTLEFKGDITLMQGYERYLSDPEFTIKPQRDA